MKLPILYHKAKNGDLRQWRVWSQGDTIYTAYGQVGGKLQTSSKKAVSKNIGRSHETTPEVQAKAEAESLWRFKIERKYSETPEAAQEELRLPMLAHKYEDKRKSVVYPAWVQPKLDGVRCLAEWDGNKVALTSRAGKPYSMPTVQKQLESWLPKNMVLYGEFMQEGYEGAMLRLGHGRYLWGYRSSELLKVKEFQDDEFVVIDARDGKGKMEGGVIWKCKCGDQTFECTMKATIEERREMYANRRKYIGKKLTVRFFDRTDDGLPRFPVGIVFREKADL
jgi:ATP-dependent DNA ligase